MLPRGGVLPGRCGLPRGASRGCFPGGVLLGGVLPGGCASWGVCFLGDVLPGGCGIPSCTEADPPPCEQNDRQV